MGIFFTSEKKWTEYAKQLNNVKQNEQILTLKIILH